jgi:hypothetical protein
MWRGAVDEGLLLLQVVALRVSCWVVSKRSDSLAHRKNGVWCPRPPPPALSGHALREQRRAPARLPQPSLPVGPADVAISLGTPVTAVGIRSTDGQEMDGLLRLAKCTRQLSGEYYAGMGWTNSGSIGVSANG